MVPPFCETPTFVWEDAEKKLNNLMLKITPKVPSMPTGSRAAFNVALSEPHPLLRKEEACPCASCCKESMFRKETSDSSHNCSEGNSNPSQSE